MPCDQLVPLEFERRAQRDKVEPSNLCGKVSSTAVVLEGLQGQDYKPKDFPKHANCQLWQNNETNVPWANHSWYRCTECLQDTGPLTSLILKWQREHQHIARNTRELTHSNKSSGLTVSLPTHMHWKHAATISVGANMDGKFEVQNHFGSQEILLKWI